MADVVVAAAAMAGALAGASGRLAPAALAAAIPAIVLLAGVIGARLRRPGLTLACAAAGLCALVGALAAHGHERAAAPTLRAILDREFGGFDLDTLGPAGRHDPVLVRVRIEEDASPAEDAILVRGLVQAVRLGGAWRPVPAERIRMAVGGDSARDAYASWSAGRVIEAPATFTRPSRYLNEGVPDHERRLALDGIALNASVKSGLLVDVTAPGSLVEERAAAVRASVRRRVARHVGARDTVAASIVTAVLIGDRSGLPDEARERLQAAGTYHVIAISGGNIAIFTALAVGLPMLGGVAPRFAAMFAMAVLVAYAHIVTAGPSVWRATLMALLYLLAHTLDHRTPPWHAVTVAAVLMVVAGPLDVRDPGFVLTFGATCALLAGADRGLALARLAAGAPPARRGDHQVSAPRSRVRKPSGLRTGLAWRTAPRILRWLVASIAASAAVELALAPVSAQAFSRVTFAGPVLNLLAVPLMAVVQVSGMALTLAAGLDRLAAAAGWVAYASAAAILESARIVEALPGLTRRIPPPGAIVVGLYYAGLALLFVPRRWARRTGALALIAAWVAVLLAGPARWGGAAAMAPDASLRLTVFDTGQAESMLLESAAAGSLLIDTAGVPFGGAFDVVDRVLAPALWARGVMSLDEVLLTHGDPDHAGGAGEIVKRFRPRTLWTGIPVPQHEPMRRILDIARGAGTRVAEVRAGQERRWGAARIRVLHPPEADWERPRVRNDDSVVLEVTAGDVAILLTGDISEAVERALIPSLRPAAIRILKVAHHGSRTSTSRDLLSAWRPQLAVISAGRANTFGHPAPEVLSRLEDAGTRVFRTDRDGQITIETDGRTVSVRTFMGGEPTICCR